MSLVTQGAEPLNFDHFFTSASSSVAASLSAAASACTGRRRPRSAGSR